MNDGAWRCWRIELTAYGEYVELTFEDIDLRSSTDVHRWLVEVRLVLSHYARPVDMLLDFRGFHVEPDYAGLCSKLLGELLDRHAASVAYFGADPWTEAALADRLAARTGIRDSARSRSPALARLMRDRRHRLSDSISMPLGLSGHPAARRWEESGTISII